MRNQVFRPGELPVVMLHLLSARPMTGYELLQELGRRFGPGYRPSPGAVYPALGVLQEKALVTADDTRRDGALRLTAAGEAVLRTKAAVVADVDARQGSAHAEAGLDDVLAEFAATARRATRVVDERRVREAVLRALRAVRKLEGGAGA